VSLLDRFIDYLRAILTIQQDVSSLKGNVQRMGDQLVNAKERIVALEKEIEYLRRELELRDEKLIEQLSRQFENRLAEMKGRQKQRRLPPPEK
jgi:predicted  nucleic acid-binding Zn-ribbon protein